MKARFKATAPDEMEFTMTSTMPLKEWEQLRTQCENEYPGFGLSSHISEMIIQAHETYWPNG